MPRAQGPSAVARLAFRWVTAPTMSTMPAPEGSPDAGVTGARTIEDLCAALLPPEAGGPEPAELAARFDAFLSRQPRFISLAVRAAVAGVDALSLATSGRRLGSLGPAGREAVLRRLARTEPGAAGLDGLKTLLLMVAGADRAAAEVLASARSTPPARPDADLLLTPAAGWPAITKCDVVVVGSGAGGAMAARTLARAGLSVVIVEEGRRHRVEEFRSDHPLDRFASLYRDGGATAAVGRPPIVLPIGRAVGGTTVVNSGTCYRTPESVLLRWRDEAGLTLADPAAFSPYLDEVWKTLQVAPVTSDVMGRNGQIMLAGAEELGWSAGPLQRNAPGCAGSCQCAIGCPNNAKFGVHLNALPDACAAGARIVSEARVERIVMESNRATGVLAHRRDGSTFTISAPRVVVAAGTTETPPLLRRSGIGGHHETGRNLALHPAIGVAGRFDKPVVAWQGVLQSAAVDEFHESHGILVEATSTPPGMGSMMLPGYGRELLKELEGADHLATLGAMVADLPAGRVLGRRRAVLTYSLTRRDAGRLVESIRVMGRILLAAGATEVLTGVRGFQQVRSEAELDEAVAACDPRSLHVAAFHPVGTVRAGSDPDRFPVDQHGALRSATGVWIADGSVLPTCPEVNPQVTIMALALAIAEGIVTST